VTRDESDAARHKPPAESDPDQQRRAQILAALDRTQEAFADVPDDELAAEIEKALAAIRAAPPQ
jgi:hypothetical protein